MWTATIINTTWNSNTVNGNNRSHYLKVWTATVTSTGNSGIAQRLEHQTPDRTVAGSRPSRRGGIIFFSTVSFLCWLLFRYPFHPYVTAKTRKRPRSFCQKCGWQVTAKRACTVRTWLCMKWRDRVHGCMMWTERAQQMAAVSQYTSHVRSKERCKYTTWVEIPNVP